MPLQARKLGREVIDRCNLVILFEPNQEDLASFLAAQKVHIIASLPCYTEENTDKQRGKRVFEDRWAPGSRLMWCLTNLVIALKP